MEEEAADTGTGTDTRTDTHAGTRWAVIVITVVAIVALLAFARGRAQRGHHAETLDGSVSVTAPAAHRADV
ncbi:MAG TPA: hypothetical protein VFV67_17035 [Actinophytocola sp.]|uniref:hypothetical protein n=1 Tax=Actinophytocola sp. TaxID=1872138 RepID=UPI002DBFE0B2|nr:hypothetical protein [Actinophytocola sp.]HEU5472359.1 hypothetical protein [Actinophytocola sp.]